MIDDYAKVVLEVYRLCERQKINGAINRKTHLSYVYRRLFYGFIDHLEHRAICYASEAAIIRFREFRPNEDLRDQNWQDQPRFDERGRAKGEFHLEHIYTGGMFRAAIDRMTDRTPENVIQLVRDNYRLAWVLKSENKLLPQSNRGDTLRDALRIYDECGVKLVAP